MVPLDVFVIIPGFFHMKYPFDIRYLSKEIYLYDLSFNKRWKKQIGPSLETGLTKLNITITIQDQENQGKVVGDGHPKKGVMP